MTLSLVIILCTIVLIGTLTSRLAKQRGRDAVTWFWLGAMFGLFAFITLYFLKDEKEVEAPQTSEPEVEKQTCSGVWYILDTKQIPVGPFSFEDIVSKFEEGALSMSSYLWHEEWADWKLASEVPEFNKKVR